MIQKSTSELKSVDFHRQFFSGFSTDDHLQVQNHHDWVARDFLVLGSGKSVHKTSSKTSLGGKSV